MAHDASLRINGCTHGGSMSLGTWCLARISCCMQCSTAWHWMPRIRINGCAHGSRIARLVMPRFESMAARMAAASLGTCCLARISCCMQGSAAQHWMLRFRINSCAHGDRIAWLGCLASDQWLHAWRQHAAWHMVPSSNQLLHAMQHRLALDASLQNQWLRT